MIIKAFNFYKLKIPIKNIMRELLKFTSQDCCSRLSIV